jgi:photosystem II stability/assembly factor-like uncharacterized protein
MVNPRFQGLTLNSVFFIPHGNANTGYEVGNSGTILKTIDGGANWQYQFSGTKESLKSVFFVNANTGYAVGGSGTIIKATNLGDSLSGIAKISDYALRIIRILYINQPRSPINSKSLG